MRRPARAWMVAGLLAGLVACSGGTPAPPADTLEAAEAREAAIVRGDAVPGQAPAGDAGAASCAKAQGTWSAPKQVCGMTESLCVATGASTWEAGTGCVVQVGSQAECTGFSGLAWTQGRCVLAHLTGQELADNGFEKERKMTQVLIVAEHLDGKLNASTAKCVSAAAALSPASIDIVVLAADPAAVAAEAAKIAGVTKVLAVANAANANPLAQVLAPQVAKLADGYTHVFGPSTTFGKDLMPCVAALIGTAQVSDVMAVEGSHVFKRPIYAGNAIVTVEAPADHVVVATVRTASWPEAAGGGSASVETVAVEAALPTHTRFVGLAAGSSDRPDLQSAKRVVSGGRGVGSEENFKVIYKFADRLGAAVGASRAAVDAGYVPNELQVGQTGKIIAPELYVAIGISGAIQHLTGIKDAGTIVAINKDADAAIFEIADIGLVGDLFTLLPELEAAL